MKLQKTKSELESDRLLRAYKKSKQPNPKKKKKKALYEPISELVKLKYADFLNTKYWAHVRRLVLKRDNFLCVVCKGDKNLQAHHETYKNHCKELQHLSDLITLCRKCHKEHHYAQV